MDGIKLILLNQLKCHQSDFSKSRALLKRARAEGKSLTGFRSLKVYEGLEQASNLVTGP